MTSRTAARRPRSRLAGPVLRADGIGMAGDFTTTVNKDQIARCTAAAASSVLMRGVLAKILGDVIDCGMEVWLNYNDERIDPRASELAVIDRDWPSFVKALLRALLVVGVAVVARDENDGRPFVVPFERVRVCFVDSAKRVREYWAEEEGAIATLARPKRMDARIFVRHEPLADGTLTSPGYACLQHAEALQSLLMCQRYSDFTRAHPTWLYEADHDRSARPDPSAYDVVYPGQISQEYNEWQQMISRQHTVMHQQTHEQSVVAYRQMLAGMGTFAAYSSAPVEARALPPWTNYTMVPLGMRMAAAPVAQPNPHFQAEIEHHSAAILSEFRVPPAEMELSHVSRFSSQPEVARQQWGATVRTHQAELSRIVSDVYMFVNRDILREYAVAVMTHVQAQRNEATATVRRLLVDEQIAKARKRQRTKEPEEPVDEPAAADGDGDKEEAAARKKAEAAVPSVAELMADAIDDTDDVGAPVKPPDAAPDAPLQFPETAASLRRAQELLELDDSEVLAYVQQRFRVTVRFCARPTFTDISVLLTLVQQNMLSMNNCATLAANVLGVPADMLITDEKERLKEAEHRRELTETLTPEPPPGAPGAAAGKRPPAAASSSSSSSDAASKKRKAKSDD